MIDEAREALAFLKAIHGSKPEDTYVVAGALSPHVNMRSFLDLGETAAYVAGKPDQYVHVGVTRLPYLGSNRPSADDIAGVGALWADIDVKHPVHKKIGLPPDLPSALQLVEDMGLPAGLVVDSGHGIQAWWPFHEAWMFETAQERRRARILARAWGITLRERAKARGYEVDMVSDLARVLRIPGTVNAKVADERLPVRVIG